MKWLLVLAVVGLVGWLLMRDRAPRRRPAQRAAAMVECAHCGVHFPSSEAVLDGSRVYCSDAHRLAGPRQPNR